MLKKTLAILACAVFASGAALADEIVVVDGLRYSLRTASYAPEPGTLQCTLQAPNESGFPTGKELSGVITVPPFITYANQKYAVTSIGRQAFYMQADVTGVDIPYTVTDISTSAFQESGITSITIPADVNDIGNYAFRKCTALKEMIVLRNVPPTATSYSFQTITSTCKVLVPKGCLAAYQKADYWKDFSTIEENPDSPVLPTSVSISGTPLNALTGTSFRLTATVLPADATDTSLEWKSLDSSVATVDAEGVVTVKAAGRANIEVICKGDRRISAIATFVAIDNSPVVDGIKYRLELDEANKIADAYVVRNSSNYTGNVTIPERFVLGTTFTVKGIDANAFALMPDVASVSIPATVDTVGFNAFRNCTGLKRVDITDISAWANISFKDRLATPLNIEGTELYLNGSPVTDVNIAGTITTVKPFTFLGIKTLTSLTIGEGVRTLSENAFKGCIALKSVVLPESVDSIGLACFEDCSALESINIPSGVRQIKGGTFANTALKSISIPDATTIIDNQAFQNCAPLESVEIGSGLEMIYLRAFDGCPEIRSITVTATTPPSFFKASVPGASLEPFSTSIYPVCTLSVPKESIDAYRNADYWKNFTNIKGIAAEEPGVTAIIDGITYRLDADTKTAEVIFCETYSGEISIPAKVAYEGADYDVNAIADGAFDGLAAVSAVNMTEAITSIGKRAFAGTSIDIARIPQTIIHLADEAFADCPKLVAVGLPDHLETIGIKAFFGSPNIRFIRCVNYGVDNDLIPPSFTTFEGDPTDYGQAFSTEIWPDCLLGIPANMFGNYKKQAGWKNFRSWGYWHTDDVEPTEITLSGGCIGRPGDTLHLTPGFLPANATILKYTLVVDDPDDVVEVTAGTDVYNVNILKEGTARLTLYGNLEKVTVEVKGDNDFGGVDSIGADADEPARYFNLQGIEVAEPAPGQLLIERRGAASRKVLY